MSRTHRTGCRRAVPAGAGGLWPQTSRALFANATRLCAGVHPTIPRKDVASRSVAQPLDVPPAPSNQMAHPPGPISDVQQKPTPRRPTDSGAAVVHVRSSVPCGCVSSRAEFCSSTAQKGEGGIGHPPCRTLCTLEPGHLLTLTTKLWKTCRNKICANSKRKSSPADQPACNPPLPMCKPARVFVF